MDEVILVDSEDRETGTMEKMEAHRKGLLHRAFSILLFNSKGEMLLQKRSQYKYHSAGLWSNTCCSHPLPGELMDNATKRKLIQEMGIDADCGFAYKFTYKVNLNNNLTEHELDHVFTGKFDGVPCINKKEVEDWKLISLPDLEREMKLYPGNYTYWFRMMMDHPEMKVITG